MTSHPSAPPGPTAALSRIAFRTRAALSPRLSLSRRAVLGGAAAVAAGGVVAACSTGGPAAPQGSGATAPTAPGSGAGGSAAAPGGTGGGLGPGTRIGVVGHRGASGYRPEHTAAAYELAIRMGADAVDVDLVPTRDGALIARHEPEIGGTTDVASHPEFADRRRTGVVVDGTAYDGWFTTDFTLAELRTLRAVERIPATRPHNTQYDGRFGLLTFDEVLDLLDRLAAELRRPVGVLPEVKHSTFFAGLGSPVEPRLVEILRRRGRDRADSGVIIQSFEAASLRALKGQVGCPLLQLADAADVSPADFVAAGDRRTYGDLASPAGLREVATYAAWFAPTKDLITPDVVGGARAAGLRTMPYTFRNENEFLPADLRRGRAGGDPAQSPPDTYGDAFAEYARYRAVGVDALFSDNPDTALLAATS